MECAVHWEGERGGQDGESTVQRTGEGTVFLAIMCMGGPGRPFDRSSQVGLGPHKPHSPHPRDVSLGETFPWGRRFPRGPNGSIMA